VLITEWPQQFPSHSVGALNFGPDGKLYAAAGDGASFGALDYGNWGIPKNPLGDPPAGVGGTMSPPTARGGSLRSQSFRRPAGDNVTLNGTIIRIDPDTGAASTGNPNLSHPDVDAKRLIAFGLRNPYRFTFHPTTGDIWIGDVGADAWEEIDRIPAPLTATPLKNFGWPCYEGAGKHSGWDGLNVDSCESLYTAGSATAPYYTYAHNQPIYSGDACGTGSSAITGLAFYPTTGGNYPASYKNALFFSDLTRKCIWVMLPGTNGLPSTATRTNFVVDAANPSDLQIGPNNDLFYTDYGGTGGTGTNVGTGKVRRIRFQAPTATFTANPTSGFAPLTVSFDGTSSTPGLPGDTLSYAWDLNGDGVYDDATGPTASRTYSTTGDVVVRLKVTDQRGGSGESQPVTIVVGALTTPPQPVIDTPAADLTWKVGDTISFSGHATDAEDGTIPDTGLLWEVIMQHCPNLCHEHIVQTIDGVASGSFPAPDHEYPSFLKLRLTATDSNGLRTSVSVDLQPQTVKLTFQTVPAPSPGLDLGFNLESVAAPFQRTVIVGSNNSLGAPSQVRGNTQYTFQSWSDGGALNHDVVAGATDTTYTATFQATPLPWISQDIGAVGAPGTWSLNGGQHTIEGAGADIWGTTDSFRFTYQQVTGDFTITARVTELERTHDFAKAGVMARATLNGNSVNFHSLVSPISTSLFRFIKRTVTGGTSSTETGPSSPLPGAPGWVRLNRTGNVWKAYTSLNGTSFTQMGTSQTVAMASTIYVGLAVTSHAAGNLATAKFDNVTITTPAPPTRPLPPQNLVATPGNGQVTLGWSASAGATSYTVKVGSMSGGSYSIVQPGLTGTSFTHGGLTNGTPYFYVVTASNSVGESDNSNEAPATPQLPPRPNPPANLKATPGDAQVALSWSAATGATSYTLKRGAATGGPYTPLPVTLTGTSFTDVGLTNGTPYFYVVTASNAGGESDNSNEASATPVAAPTWQSQDIGAVAATGSWSQSGGTFTVKGSGADIYNGADEFRFVYRAVSGNATLIARVASIQNVNTWSKAAIMIRNGLSAGATNVAMLVSPTDANGYRWQVRAANPGSTTSTKGGAGTRPVWFKLVRNGNTLTGSYSANGSTWTQLGTTSITMSSTVQIGLAVTSHVDGSLATGVFDNVSLTTP
jgi:glucose/arabinose dehydrogenase/regulation of enolase protein 1 (concanavalin A-like superfamily)